MGRLAHASSFKDLLVYQKAFGVARKVFDVTKSMPKEEVFSLTDQVRRSSRSIGAQIAEAWAKRRYHKQFVSKLTDADAEQMETQHWIDIAKDCGYLDGRTAGALSHELSEIGRMLNGMMEKAHEFCGKDGLIARESDKEYFLGEA